jgi:hypothetical protein
VLGSLLACLSACLLFLSILLLRALSLLRHDLMLGRTNGVLFAFSRFFAPVFLFRPSPQFGPVGCAFRRWALIWRRRLSSMVLFWVRQEGYHLAFFFWWFPFCFFVHSSSTPRSTARYRLSHDDDDDDDAAADRGCPCLQIQGPHIPPRERYIGLEKTCPFLS